MIAAHSKTTHPLRVNPRHNPRTSASLPLFPPRSRPKNQSFFRLTNCPPHSHSLFSQLPFLIPMARIWSWFGGPAEKSMKQAAFSRTCPEGDPNLTRLKPDPNQNPIPGLDYVLGFGFFGKTQMQSKLTLFAIVNGELLSEAKSRP